MRFKDEDGREWEPVPPMTNFSSQETIIIRPIIEPKKWEVEIHGNIFQNTDSHTRIEVLLKNPFSVHQSELIKEAVEATMEHTFASMFDWRDTQSAITKARRLIQQEEDDE